jgi:hypothetical protein
MVVFEILNRQLKTLLAELTLGRRDLKDKQSKEG